MTAEDIIKRATAEIGTKENPAGSNCVKYNTWYYGREVRGDAYPWCMAFISWLFRDTGLFPKSASCANTGSWFKANAAWHGSPEIGDLIFFKYGTNSRWTNHVGLVVGIEGKNIITIEGNTSKTSNDNGGAVMKRTRTSNIVGFGRPKYSESDKTYLPTLKKGSRGDHVRAWQNYLMMQGYNIASDGIFGPETEKAVKAWQKEAGLNPTGIITEKEWNAIGVK